MSHKWETCYLPKTSANALSMAARWDPEVDPQHLSLHSQPWWQLPRVWELLGPALCSGDNMRGVKLLEGFLHDSLPIRPTNHACSTVNPGPIGCCSWLSFSLRPHTQEVFH